MSSDNDSKRNNQRLAVWQNDGASYNIASDIDERRQTVSDVPRAHGIWDITYTWVCDLTTACATTDPGTKTEIVELEIASPCRMASVTAWSTEITGAGFNKSADYASILARDLSL